MAKPFVWPGTAHEATLTVKFTDGSGFNIITFTGPWAVFEFFSDADTYRANGGGATLEWKPRTGRNNSPILSPSGQPLKIQFDLEMGGGPPVFQRDYFPSMVCPER